MPLQQHRIPIAEKAVALGNGVAVQAHDVGVAGKSAYQHHQGAFAGYAHIMGLYRHAIAQRYRFFSYGDAMLLERAKAAN